MRKKEASKQMIWPDLVEGESYRLLREFEIHDEKTGTPKAFLRKGALVKVRRLDPDDDHVFVEGQSLPLPLGALRRMVEPLS